ncbi:MAG: hypothetical protein GY756_18185 [bacterium]|nr:hypothetical protein [bacterium]
MEAGSLAAQNQIVIGFSLLNPKSNHYIKILSEGIDELRKSGELEIILAAYGLADWK